MEVSHRLFAEYRMIKDEKVGKCREIDSDYYLIIGLLSSGKAYDD